MVIIQKTWKTFARGFVGLVGAAKNNDYERFWSGWDRIHKWMDYPKHGRHLLVKKDIPAHFYRLIAQLFTYVAQWVGRLSVRNI